MSQTKTYAFLFFVSFLAYVPSLFNGFINLDDPFYVMNNPIFRPDFFSQIFVSNQAGNWHPLTMLSHAFDISVFGLEPLWHHLFNVFFHSVTVILVFRWLGIFGQAYWGRLSVALLWSLHPVQIQTVAWVSERKNILSMLFILLGLLFWHKYKVQNEKKFYFICFGSFILGMMSKVIVVVFPVLLVLLELHYQRSPKRWEELLNVLMKNSVKLWPFFLLSLVFGILAIQLQGEAHAIGGLSLVDRIIGSIEAMGSYFKMLIWPTKLAVMYPINPEVQWDLIGFGVVFIGGLIAAVVFCGNRFPNVTLGAAWFVVTLLPTLGFIQVGHQSHADRYLYLPLLGLLIMALHLPKEKWFEKRAIKLILLIPFLGLIFFVQKETRIWKSTASVFTAAAERVPNNWYAHESLGVEYLNQMNPIGALSHFETVLNYSPENASVMRYMVRAHLMMNKVDEAKNLLGKIDQIEPDYFETDFMWAKYYYQENFADQAFQRAEMVIEKAPYFGEGYELIVQILLQMQDIEQAKSFAEFGFKNTGRQSLKQFLDQFNKGEGSLNND